MTKLKTKKTKPEKTDGLGPNEKKKISSAIRQVWYRSTARQKIVKACTDSEGFPFCPSCKKRVPKIQIDHIEPCGAVESDGYITRLFCPSSGLQGMCKSCHKEKTNQDKKKVKRGVKIYRPDPSVD